MRETKQWNGKVAGDESVISIVNHKLSNRK